MVLTCILSMHAGGEQPIPLWNEHDTSTDADKPKILLYSLSLMFKVSHVHVSFSMKSQTNTSDSLGKATRWRLSSNFVLFYVIKPEGLLSFCYIFWTQFFLFTGNPDDSHNSFYASCTLWDGPHWTGAIQQDPVQGSARRQQQLP